MDQDPQMQGAQPGNSSTPTPTTPVPEAASAVENTNLGATDNNAPVPPVAASTEPVPNTPAMPPSAPAEPVAPPKKRTGLIAAIVALAVVLLAIIGVAVWYFCFHSNPDKVAYDAMTGFLKQPNVVTDGSVVARAETENGSMVSVGVALQSKSNGSAGESTVNVNLSVADANGQAVLSEDYEVAVSNIITSDGVIYVRTDKLLDTIDLMIEDMVGYVDATDEDFQLLYDLIGEIDGEWWEISVPDLVDEFVDDSNVASAFDEFYTCMVDVSHQNIGAQLANIYHDNRFVNIEKIQGGLFGDSTYHVTLDAEQMANFMNATLDIDAGKEAEKCIDNFTTELGGTYEIEKTYIKASDIKDFADEVDFEMVISNFGHELKQISAGLKDLGEDEYFKASFAFSHLAVTVSAPQSYRPISELLEQITEAVMTYWGYDSTYDPASDPAYGPIFDDPALDWSYGDSDWDTNWDDDWT